MLTTLPNLLTLSRIAAIPLVIGTFYLPAPLGPWLGGALFSQYVGGLTPCELCLLERWPYRVAIGLGLVGLVLPRRPARWLLGLLVLAMLAGAALGALHVGVEQGAWPSPLPECAAPHFSGRTVAERLARPAAR